MTGADRRTLFCCCWGICFDPQNVRADKLGFTADLSTHSALIIVITFQLFDALPIREHPQRRAALGKLLLPSHCCSVAEEARVSSVGEAPSSAANKLKGVCSLTAVLFANLSCRWAELFGSSSQSRRCDAVSPGRLAGKRGRFHKVLSTGSRQKGFVLFCFVFVFY